MRALYISDRTKGVTQFTTDIDNETSSLSIVVLLCMWWHKNVLLCCVRNATDCECNYTVFDLEWNFNPFLCVHTWCNVHASVCRLHLMEIWNRINMGNTHQYYTVQVVVCENLMKLLRSSQHYRIEVGPLICREKPISTKRYYVWCKINRKSVITIKNWFGLIRYSEKIFHA